MKKNEWLKMMEQDLVTASEEDKQTAGAVLEAAKEVLKSASDAFEVDSALTCKKIHEAMYAEASKKRKGNSYCFTTPMAFDFIAKKLGLSGGSAQQAAAPVGAAKTVDLADFL
jgi:hypothetical protein